VLLDQKAVIDRPRRAAALLAADAAPAATVMVGTRAVTGLSALAP
jgi:hypothetical protein